MKSIYSVAALKWLEGLLSNHFGIALSIENSAPEVLKITIQDAPGFIEFSTDPQTFNRSDSNLPYTTWNPVLEGWKSVLNTDLPVPGVLKLKLPLITHKLNGFHVNYDILGMIYWILSRKEEVGRTDLDEHGRFPSTSSHAFKYGYLERPVVDEWMHLLGQMIKKLCPSIKLKEHKFTIKVSHDVDCPSRYGFRSVSGLLRVVAGDVFKRRDIKNAILSPWIFFKTKKTIHPLDPANTFDWMMDVSEKNNLNSAFYFICGHTDKRDADYTIMHPAIRNLMRNIHKRGHEIGLHPSYGAYKKPNIIKSEAEHLKKICAEENIHQNYWGGRMHYLRWEQPITLKAWADAGMSYDSTLGYADRPGFRAGTCFEYAAFDPENQKILPLQIRPLIAMECTIIAARYMGLGVGDVALNKFLSLKNICNAVGGCFTLLWHNSHFDTEAEKQMYLSILEAKPSSLTQ